MDKIHGWITLKKMRDSRRKRFLKYMLGKRGCLENRTDRDIRNDLLVGGLILVAWILLIGFDSGKSWISLAIRGSLFLLYWWYYFELSCELWRRTKKSC